MSWDVSRSSEFVIWPLVHPEIASGEELQAFRFERLKDRFGIQKGRMLASVTGGNFSEAAEQLKTLRELFARIGIRDEQPEPSICCIDRWRFTIHRDLAEKAREFRATRGSSRVTLEQVQTEREWRRTMINMALKQRPGQRLRDFVRAANSWAEYSREVYSRLQRHWPDRPLASNKTGGSGFVKDGPYAGWLREDIVLIKEKLGNDKIQVLIDENANRQAPMTRLSDGQLLAVQSFPDLLVFRPYRKV